MTNYSCLSSRSSILFLWLCASPLAYGQVVSINGAGVAPVGSATLVNINRPDANKASYNQFSSF